MQIDINVKTYSTKQRILAFFMAFMIFTMTCPEIFEGWGLGLIVHAAPTAGSGTIMQVPTYSKYMGQTGYMDSHGDDGNVNGTYTGKILPQSVSMYDYLTDYEKNNSKWNKLSGNKNNYTWYNRYEPYTQFNRSISTTFATANTVTSPASNNITIVYKTLRYTSSETVYVHYWNSSDDKKSTAWPGKVMNYTGTDGAYSVFSYTVDADGCGFAPNSFIFNNNSTKTETFTQSVSKGNKYTFTESITIECTMSSSYSYSDVYIYMWNDAGEVNETWPGEKMTSLGSKKYTYTFSGQYKKFQLNCGSNAYQVDNIPFHSSGALSSCK